jgi:hypothetical protein
MTKVANANRLGAMHAHMVRYPAATFALWARSGKCRFFRLDLLHAITDRLPVIGDWFRHVRDPPEYGHGGHGVLQQSAMPELRLVLILCRCFVTTLRAQQAPVGGYSSPSVSVP